MSALNIVSVGFVSIYLLQLFFALWIERLNLGHLRIHGGTVPPCLTGFVDRETLDRIRAYAVDNSRLFLVEKTVRDLVLLGLIASGFLAWFNHYAATHQMHYLVAGLVFFLVIGATFFVLGLPFDYYHTFVIEEKFGFNRSDLRIWALDLIKGTALSVALLAAVLSPVLWVVKNDPTHWWLWGFLIVSATNLVLVVLYPVLIAPIFNTFEPLRDTDLAEKAQSLVNRAGFKARGIYQMDACKRSSHSNAYFTGIGRTKRIVLFDTLIDQHTHDEILAVLAHEIGHWKLKHVLKSYLTGQLGLFAGFYMTYLLLNWDLLHRTFAISGSQPYLGLFVIGIFWQKAGYFFRPLAMAFSRRFEKQADRFAARLQRSAKHLATALKKMARHNLSNPSPHPFYVWFNYSHPPIPERIVRLEKISCDEKSR